MSVINIYSNPIELHCVKEYPYIKKYMGIFCLMRGNIIQKFSGTELCFGNCIIGCGYNKRTGEVFFTKDGCGRIICIEMC